MSFSGTDKNTRKRTENVNARANVNLRDSFKCAYK